MIKTKNHTPLSRFLPIFLFVAITQFFLLTQANAARRVVTFTNGTGQNADDLHIVTKKGVTIDWKKTTPFDSDRGKKNDSSHNLYNATVPPGGTATVAMDDDDATTIEIKDAWWTSGGNSKKDGEKIGDDIEDDGSNQLGIVGGPAAGDGVVQININGESGIFMTTPGSSPDSTKAQFSVFLSGFVDSDGNELIHQGFLESSNLLYASNILGSPGLGLSTEILVQDSGQSITLLPPLPGPPVFRFSITAAGGGCPGPYIGEVEDAIPGGQVAIYQGTIAEPSPSEVCPGVMLEIAVPVLTNMLTPDENGGATFDFEAMGCGVTLLQALDLASCTLGNVTGPDGN